MTSIFHTHIKTRPGAVPQRTDTDFGLADAKGRQIGFRCTITPVVSMLDEDHPRCGWLLDFTDTEFFSLNTTTTRDGMQFGASTADFMAVTLAEVEVEATRRTNVARKRYLKKLGVK